MVDQGESGSKIDEYIKGLRERAAASRAVAADYESQAEFLREEKGLLERYGQLPLAMQTTQFIIEQIATTSHKDEIASIETPYSGRSNEVQIGGSAIKLRPRTRYAIPREEKKVEGGKKYNISPPVKPIMNAIVGIGHENVPETLDSLFDRMYAGQDWHSKIIRVPQGIGRKHQEVTYTDDLKSGDSYLRRLVRGADEIINTRMRGNSTPLFAFRGKVAATELIQLYHAIEGISWDIYDAFMIRNGLREKR